eukprot:jgi/Mesvir1/2145/Mv25643-RA.1
MASERLLAPPRANSMDNLIVERGEITEASRGLGRSRSGIDVGGSTEAAPCFDDSSPLLGRSSSPGHGTSGDAATSSSGGADGGASGGHPSQRSSAVQRVRTNANEHVSNQRRSLRSTTLFLALEMMVRIAQVVACIVVLSLSTEEHPHAPLRLWVGGYGLHAVAVMALLTAKLRFRYEISQGGGDAFANSQVPAMFNRAEAVLEMFWTSWFLLGNLWLYNSTNDARDAPQLFRITLIFVVAGFIVYALPLVLCLAICCCLPCVILVLATMSDPMHGKGATEQAIRSLPVTKFKKTVGACGIGGKCP